MTINCILFNVTFCNYSRGVCHDKSVCTERRMSSNYSYTSNSCFQRQFWIHLDIYISVDIPGIQRLQLQLSLLCYKKGEQLPDLSQTGFSASFILARRGQLLRYEIVLSFHLFWLYLFDDCFSGDLKSRFISSSSSQNHIWNSN